MGFMPPRSAIAPDSDQMRAFRDLLGIKQARAQSGHTLLDKTRAVVPFDGVIVSGLDVEGLRFGTATLLATNLPPAFLEAYIGERHIEADPITDQLTLSPEIIADGEVSDGHFGRRRSTRLDYLFDYFEVKRRTIFPLWRGSRCYGGLVVTRDKPFSEEERTYLKLLAGPLHAALSEPVLAQLNRALGLTQGEMRCLELASHGLTSEEVAGATDFAFETVNTYLKSAARKLGAANRTHAVAEAVRRKLIV